MKGQGSVEYMAIFAAMLVIFAMFTHAQMVEPAGNLARETEDLSAARNACDKIAASIDRVYKNAESAKTIEFAEFSGIENLEISEDNVQISIIYDENVLWVSSSIKYGFDNSLTNISNGVYTVIVEWDNSKTEVITLDQENDEVYININPGGG